MKQWKIGILLFNEVEVLDFSGPFEVFSISYHLKTGISNWVFNSIP